jgi:hypothetical protein
MSSSSHSPGEGPVDGGLQFDRAEHLPTPDAAGNPIRQCVACKQPIAYRYFHAQGQTVCETCAERILRGQQAPPALSLARALLYGAGAAAAGCAIYAIVAIVTGLELALIAIVVGVMVGKAVRLGSGGRGGRPQQILAVVLTYFAITTSYIPVLVYEAIKHPQTLQRTTQSGSDSGAVTQQSPSANRMPTSFVSFLFLLLLIAAAAPFLALSSGVGAFISLFIIFIGLRQAWKLTGRSELLVMGPYEVNASQP